MMMLFKVYGESKNLDVAYLKVAKEASPGILNQSSTTWVRHNISTGLDMLLRTVKSCLKI